MQDAETNTSCENCVLGHSIHKSLDSFHNWALEWIYTFLCMWQRLKNYEEKREFLKYLYRLPRPTIFNFWQLAGFWRSNTPSLLAITPCIENPLELQKSILPFLDPMNLSLKLKYGTLIEKHFVKLTSPLDLAIARRTSNESTFVVPSQIGSTWASRKNAGKPVSSR